MSDNDQYLPRSSAIIIPTRRNNIRSEHRWWWDAVFWLCMYVLVFAINDALTVYVTMVGIRECSTLQNNTDEELCVVQYTLNFYLIEIVLFAFFVFMIYMNVMKTRKTWV